MSQDTEGLREARKRGWTGAAAVEFAKHWDLGGPNAVHDNRALIKAAFEGERDQRWAQTRSSTLPQPDAVYARRAAAVRAAVGEPDPQPRALRKVMAHPEQVYAARARGQSA